MSEQDEIKEFVRLYAEFLERVLNPEAAAVLAVGLYITNNLDGIGASLYRP